MKFQNPSLNSVLTGRTNGRTHKPKPICSPLFQSWGHKKHHVNLVTTKAPDKTCLWGFDHVCHKAVARSPVPDL